VGGSPHNATAAADRKIFKENIEAVISSIMQNVLKITAISMEELPDDRWYCLKIQILK
jgi:hypothetical protein